MDSTKKPDKEHPRSRASPLSRLFFIWVMKLLRRGSKKGLSVRDITKCVKNDVSSDLGYKLERNWNNEILKATKKKRKPHFGRIIFKTFWTTFIFDGFLVLCQVFIRTVAPLIVAQLLFKFQNNKFMLINNLNLTDKISVKQIDDINNENKFEKIWYQAWNDVNWLSGFLIIFLIISCILYHHVELRERLLGARIRIACSSVIYRKTLRLSKAVSGKTPVGQIINLISNDVGRFDIGFIYVHYIWVLPLQAALIIFLTWKIFGYASVIGVVVLLVQAIPVQTAISKITSIFRNKIAINTDKRVGLMSEIVAGIHVLKMYAWEKPFKKIVTETRKSEIKQILYNSYLRSFFVSSIIFGEKITLFVTMISLIAFNRNATPDLIFSIAQYFSALQLTASIFYPLAIIFGAEARVSIRRIEQFLLLEEMKKSEAIIYQKQTKAEDEYVIKITRVFASWHPDDIITLAGLELNIKGGNLCAIIGPVGAGKSSFLHLLLKELPIISGKVQVFGDISYASQDPFLFAGTVRNNILLGEIYDSNKYNEIAICCALIKDFEQLPENDQTVLDAKGASLSGGQRARISLARAVYKKASIYLMDDPLSAVDSNVGRHLFNQVMGPDGYLAKINATRILITHQVHFLSDADWIVILENGRISHQGTYNDLVKNEKVDIFKMVDNEATYTENEDSSSAVELERYISVRNRSSLSMNKRISTVHIQYDVEYTEHFEEEEEEKVEKPQRKKSTIKVLKEYFLAGCNSNSFALFLYFVLCLLSQVVISSTDFFVNIFTGEELKRLNNLPELIDSDTCTLILACLIIAVIIATLLRAVIFFKMCMRASTELHVVMFNKIMNASMRFFDLNSSGTILNRFSRDIGVVDEYLPRALMDCIQVVLLIFGILVLVTIVNPYLLIAICIVLIVYYLNFRFYLRTSLDLKRLDGLCKGPVFSHLSSTFLGASTIRSKNIQKVLVNEFDSLQDIHSGIWLSTMAVNAALGLWVDAASICLIAVVAFSFTTLNPNSSSASVGLAISQAVMLAGLVQYGIRQIAETLQFMISVERVLEYTDIEQESITKKSPPKFWPTYGKIQFRDMSLSYGNDLPPTLKHLNFIVEPAWKVGVVGRTGAGKSSIMNALFRLGIITGKIYIDDIDIESISLVHLRSKISIIPQEPLLFSATIRFNLDPFGIYQDIDIWKALDDVELAGVINSLNFLVTEGGSNFSVGERQLLSLARAILRNNKIIILDEATANVDPQMDELIQKTIRTKFKECTVLTIAHRLHTIIDSDRVITMDAGSLAEYDIPFLLLKIKDGIFRYMVDATGPTESANLKRIAAQKHKELTQKTEEK